MLSPRMRDVIYDSLIECDFSDELSRIKAMRAYKELIRSEDLQSFKNCIDKLYDEMFFTTYCQFLYLAVQRMVSLCEDGATDYHCQKWKRVQR